MYADPEACPDCRLPINAGATACPHCALSLTGPTAQQLFVTLQHADRLVAELRAASGRPSSVPAPGAAPTPVVAPTAGAAASGTRTAGLPAHPSAPPRPRRRLLNLDTVPAILVGVGALCLLVAALVFLAVAWSVLGVGGRAVTLVVLTAAFGAVALLLTRKGLRAGAEGLWAVTLGLVALDVVGLEYAGWLGEVPGGWLLAATGGALAAAGVAVGTLGRSSAVQRLIVPELLGGLGVLVGCAGMVGAWAVDIGDLAIAAVLTLGLAALAEVLRLRAALVVLLVSAAGWWSVLAIVGLDHAGRRADLAHMWGEGRAWPLLVAMGLAAAVAAYPRADRWLRVLAAAGGCAVALAVVAVPFGDEEFHWVLVAGSGLLVGLALVVRRLPHPWRLAPLAAVLPVALTVGVGCVLCAAVALQRLWRDEPWSVGADAVLRRPDLDFSALPLVPALAALLVTAGLLAPLLTPALGARRTTRQEWVWAGVTVLGLGAVVTLAHHDLPRWVVSAALVVLVLLLAEEALLRRDPAPVRLVAAAVAGLAAVAAALPSDVLTAITLVVLIAVLVPVDVRGRGADRPGWVGDGAAATWVIAVAGLIWSAGHALDLARPHVALATVAVLGLLALGRSLAAYEIAAWAGIAVSVLLVVDDAIWLAVALTVAGALAAAAALVRDDRRELGWVGTALLTAATWVRLLDLGETTPEWYTLPLATGLVVYGVVRMLRDRDVASLPALAPGLGLALTPSLLVALVEPVSLRALLLGLACAVLVLVGFALRWEAPLLIGAAVGVVLVLRQAIEAEVLQQWYSIGLVGALVLVVGVTWEARLRQLRRAFAYVREMR